MSWPLFSVHAIEKIIFTVCEIISGILFKIPFIKIWKITFQKESPIKVSIALDRNIDQRVKFFDFGLYGL